MPGEFTGLIGSNGAGKTTLFRVILGLQTPSTGSVLVGGRPLTRRNPIIGYVPQKIFLDPDMPLRARDVVALGLDGHRLGVPLGWGRRRKAVDSMLDAVDARRFADARVGNLSGGEQQRVLIAHALISRPRLLLLDEPLANLDIGAEGEVVALLARIAREQRIAVFISAHDVNPLLPVMDRLVYVAAGKTASGTTAEVIRPEVLSALYGQHVDVLRVHGRILVVAGAEGPSGVTFEETEGAVVGPDIVSLR
jgi:zinc/manganese transport system ATP-binding protein